MLRHSVWPNEVLHVHLFTNDLDPDEDTNLEEFTELVASGYEVKDVTRAGWSEPVMVDDLAVVQQPSVAPWRWENPGTTRTVFGYYVTDEDDSEWIWAERWEEDQEVTVNQALEYALKFTFGTDHCS